MTIKALEQFVEQCKTCSTADNPNLARELLETAVLVAEDVIKKRSKRTPETADTYGEYGNVKLTHEQYMRLTENFGITLIARYISEVDDYCQQSGKKYKDYSVAIRNFMKRNGIRPVIRKGDKSKCPY